MILELVVEENPVVFERCPRQKMNATRQILLVFERPSDDSPIGRDTFVTRPIEIQVRNIVFARFFRRNMLRKNHLDCSIRIRTTGRHDTEDGLRVFRIDQQPHSRCVLNGKWLLSVKQCSTR